MRRAKFGSHSTPDKANLSFSDLLLICCLGHTSWHLGDTHYSTSSAPFAPTMSHLSQRTSLLTGSPPSCNVLEKVVCREPQDPSFALLRRGDRRGVRGYRSRGHRPSQCHYRFDDELVVRALHRRPEGRRCEGEGQLRRRRPPPRRTPLTRQRRLRRQRQLRRRRPPPRRTPLTRQPRLRRPTPLTRRQRPLRPLLLRPPLTRTPPPRPLPLRRRRPQRLLQPRLAAPARRSRR